MKRIIVVTAAMSLWSGVALAKESAGGDRSGALASCPSAVPGATTILENVKEGVVVTVTSDDERVTDEIRRRAHVQEKAPVPSGACPSDTQGTRLAVDEIPDGARLTVRASSSADVQALQQTSRARLRDLEARR